MNDSASFIVEVNSKSPVTVQEVTVLYDGIVHKFVVPVNKSILQAALDKDIELPYSCQSGMCTACMGLCKTGKVKLHDPDGLSDNDIKKGYVLLCVAQPLSEDLIIEIE